MRVTTSDHRVFYLTVLDEREEEVEDIVNPIAQGLSIAEESSSERPSWGYCSWFDKIAASMCSIEMKSPPLIEKNKIYHIQSSENLTYKFQLIDKQLYDILRRNILEKTPSLQTDEAIQDYLSRINPYQ